MLEVEVSGIDELFTALDTTIQRVNRGVNKVLKESATPIKERLEETVPVLPSPKHPLEGHARDDIRVTNVKTTNGGLDKHVDVGFNKTEWRMWFLEFGTINIAPRFYVQKAMTFSRGEVFKRQKEGLMKLIHQRGLG